jgi:hypothetical protein
VGTARWKKRCSARTSKPYAWIPIDDVEGITERLDKGSVTFFCTGRPPSGGAVRGGAAASACAVAVPAPSTACSSASPRRTASHRRSALRPKLAARAVSRHAPTAFLERTRLVCA